MKGEIKFYDVDRGFGFIAPDGDGPDIFFHIRNSKSDSEMLLVSARVEFEEARSKRRDGKEAVAVRVLDDPAAAA